MGGVKFSLLRVHRTILAMVCAWVALALLAAMPIAAGAGDAATLRVSQAVATLPDVRVYLEIGAADGSPVSGIRLENLTAAIGTKPVSVNSIQPFSESGEGVAYIFLVDISKSLKEKQFRQVRQVLGAWIDAMAEKDQAAIMTFGTEVAEIQAFTSDKAALQGKISELKPIDQYTQLHLGLVKAAELGHRLDPGVPSRKVIVVLSDGQDDFEGGLTKQVVLDKMRVDPVPVYAIGVSNLSGEKRDRFLKLLGEFAVTSGGTYIRADSSQFAQAFEKMRRNILAPFVLKLSCEACQGDGGVHRLQINFLGGPTRMTDGLDIRLLASPTKPASPMAVVAPDRASDPTFQVQPSPSEPKGLGGYWWVLLVAVALIGGLVKRREILEWIWGKEEPPLPPKRMKLRLTQIKGDPLKEPFEMVIDERLVMGRDNSCDIVLTDDKKISRNHCELSRQGEEIFIRDLGSKNTTLVNGVPIAGTHKLESDDTIALGNVEFRLGIIEP